MSETTKKGGLFMVATPIGNLSDITLRALETLKDADVVFSEDTRVTSKLLSHFAIKKPLFRYDEHSHKQATTKIIQLLKEGKKIALTTDAGTPGIADPGGRLVAEVSMQLPDITITPIPGVSAITTILSVSGMNTEKFTFWGYSPHKKGRKTFFENLKENKVWPVVFYESPHRIEKALNSIVDVMGGDQTIIIGRELTKLHEEVFKGCAKDAVEIFKEEGRARGEFVVVVGNLFSSSPND
ncbi:MAG: 16S rRNA (cytidine(1402)-2'-O)-methyltransferase [bacterium]